MAAIKLTGDTSGEITIAAPAVAGTNTLTLPASTGNIVTDDGAGKIDASGGGIYLGGTAAANLLDDYEEGTFSPGLTGSTGTPTISYSNNDGYYIKVGDLVNIWGHITVSSVSGGSGQIWINGLPFTVATTVPGTTVDGGGALNYFVNWGSTRSYISASPIENSATLRLYQLAGAGGSSFAATNFVADILSSTSIRFWGMYKAA